MAQVFPLISGTEEHKDHQPSSCNFEHLYEESGASKKNKLEVIGKMYDLCKTTKQDIPETSFNQDLISISFTYNARDDNIKIEVKKYNETIVFLPESQKDVEYSGGWRGKTAQFLPKGAILNCPILSTTYTPLNKERLITWMSRRIK
tara:strand:+ start:217 stop:657 length:441 start_codon:yes stop_codon:yes gene_type:complete